MILLNVSKRRKVLKLTLGFKKRGSIFLDMIVIVVILFVVAIIFGAAYYIKTEAYIPIMEEFNESGDTQSAEILEISYDRSDQLYDGILVFFIIGLFVVSWISAFILDAHPIFAVIILLLCGGVLFVGMLLTNTYEQLATEGAFTVLRTNFPLSYYVFSHWLIVGIVYLMSVGGIIYAKNQYMS